MSRRRGKIITTLNIVMRVDIIHSIMIQFGIVFDGDLSAVKEEAVKCVTESYNHCILLFS